MYGLRAVRGMIDVICPELRGIRFTAFQRLVMNSTFNRSFFPSALRRLSASPLLGGSVIRAYTV